MVLLLAAQTASAAVKTSEVTFKSGKDKVKGFLAMPEGKGPFPAIVVIQEWWGLTDWVKDNARRFAEKGYVALAPDLYRGKAAKDGDYETARELMKGLPRDRAVRDLKGAVHYLAKHDKVNKEKIGSIGWCMGGGYSLALALKDKRIKACVICYGRVETEAEDVKPLKATVLGIFGKKDRGIPPATVRKFGAALKEAGKKVEGIKEYDAGHGFMRPGKKNKAYNADAAKEAWKEIDKFFAKALKAE
jgi:carboxymethylenebutenolidase